MCQQFNRICQDECLCKWILAGQICPVYPECQVVLLSVFVHRGQNPGVITECNNKWKLCPLSISGKTIVLKKNQNMCDDFLEKIGSRKPVSLSLIQCRGNLVTSTGLRELFRRCSENLEVRLFLKSTVQHGIFRKGFSFPQRAPYSDIVFYTSRS